METKIFLYLCTEHQLCSSAFSCQNRHQLTVGSWAILLTQGIWQFHWTWSLGKKSNYGQASVLSLITAHHEAMAGRDLLRLMVKPTPQSQVSVKGCWRLAVHEHTVNTNVFTLMILILLEFFLIVDTWMCRFFFLPDFLFARLSLSHLATSNT